ncbi:hypothetical protein D3C76_1442100 [compost metagenome]
MAAWLQCDISGAPLCLAGSHIQCVYFSVSCTALQMCTEADHGSVFYNYTADNRVNTCLSLCSFRHVQRKRHVELVI